MTERQRLLDEIVQANRSQPRGRRTSVEGGRILPGDYRVARLVDVDFVGVNMSGVKIRRPMIRRGVLERCSFTNVRWDQMLVDGVSVVDCTFDRLRAEDVHVTNCQIENSSFIGASLNEATFVDTHLRRVRLTDLHAERPFFDKCTVSDARLSGQASGLVVPFTTRLSDVDLSGLAMEEASIDGEMKNVSFPTTRTCFAVPAAALIAILPELSRTVSEPALRTYEAYVKLARSPIWIVDRQIFDLRGYDIGEPLSAAEVNAVLTALYPHRVAKVEHVAPARLR
jgi:uncharacterized protein YjbI with pentapeptide repeats